MENSTRSRRTFIKSAAATSIALGFVGLDGVASNNAVVVPGVQNKIGATVLNAMPRSVRRFALDKIPR